MFQLMKFTIIYRFQISLNIPVLAKANMMREIETTLLFYADTLSCTVLYSTSISILQLKYKIDTEQNDKTQKLDTYKKLTDTHGRFHSSSKPGAVQGKPARSSYLLLMVLL
jgi:hypothetical protein